jgi:hypothetical protein
VARFKNDPFPGTDYNSYQTWERVVTPSGQVLYVVPGNPGYVFDPVASNASGRKVFRINPQQQISAQQKEQDARDRAIKQQEQANSPAGQLLPVAAGVAGTVGSAYAINKLTGQPVTPTVVPGSNQVAPVVQPSAPVISPQASAAAQGATQGAAPQAGPAAPQTPATGDAGVSAPTAQPVTEVGSVTMPDGTPGKLMSDGGKVGTETGEIINPDGTKGGTVTGQALAGLQIAGGAAQMYSGYRQYKAGEKLGGAANMAGGAFGAAAGAQALAAGGTAGSLASYVPGVGWVVAGAQIGQQMLNDKGASEDRAAAAQYEAQKASLLFIPGYGWVAYAALAAADALTKGKAGKAIMGFNKKMDDNVINKIDFGIKKSLDKKLFHQSTKGVQQMHSGQLMAQSDDPTWQNYVAGMRQGMDGNPKDPLKPFAGGKYATFDEYKQAGLQADDLTGVYGNLDAFKPDYAEKAGVPDWSKLTFEQQRYMTQKLIDADAYASKKGEVVIPDKEKARRIYEQEAKTNFGLGVTPTVPGAPAIPGASPVVNKPAVVPGASPNALAAAAGASAQRSTTRSPGIGLDGRRIFTGA